MPTSQKQDRAVYRMATAVSCLWSINHQSSEDHPRRGLALSITGLSTASSTLFVHKQDAPPGQLWDNHGSARENSHVCKTQAATPCKNRLASAQSSSGAL